MKTRFVRILGVFGVAALFASSAVMVATGAADAPTAFAIKAISTDASRVTGGDVLLEIVLPSGAMPSALKVAAGGRDVTSVFKMVAPVGKLVKDGATWGLVTGLPIGKTTITAALGTGAPASLEVTNYPMTGPVFSGPWIKPFICQTQDFVLPDGGRLGPPLDENCSARTVIQYVYRSTLDPATAAARGGAGANANGAGAAAVNPSDPNAAAAPAAQAAARGRGAAAPPAFRPLPSPMSLPSDVAMTTTTDGVTVPFVVRVETGTMDRGIYQSAILFDPTHDAPASATTPPRGWNHRLIGVHGSGCPGGWYIQGGREGVSPLDLVRLGQGYALFVNSLNHPTNSCNAVVAGEAAMMGKEHFIETFGVPLYTMSTGGSGGAYTSLQLADNYPGLFDGVSVSATFPDALAIAMSGLDGHLLTHYFHVTKPAGLTDEQKNAISGYSGVKALEDAANQSERTDPVPHREDIQGYNSAVWNAAVPEALRYDPVNNPKGARPTVFDVAKNVYGVDAATGYALRPYDNVGVQYGLNALNSGAITTADFLELNDKIGGFDHDANYVSSRTAGDAGAMKRAYQAGLMLSGKGGLANIPVFDNATKNEMSGYHYAWFDFALRDRLREANGNSSNMVIWRSTTPAALQAVFDKWMIAYMSDKGAGTTREKMLRNKPAAAVEGCYDKSTPPAFVAENLIFSSKPVSKCSGMYPVYSNPRHEAGGPLAANVFKCQLKPVDVKDYKTPMSASDMAKLKTIFPAGVCDFSKPGVSQTPVVAWASFGPSPKNQIFDVSRP
jgi:hypothetical protein